MTAWTLLALCVAWSALMFCLGGAVALLYLARGWGQ